MDSERDEWLRKRVFELEGVIELLIRALATAQPMRQDLIREARERMPQ